VVGNLRDLNVTRTSGYGVDPRATRDEISQLKGKRIKEPVGQTKILSGGRARLMLRRVARLRFNFTLTMVGYDIIRLPKLPDSPQMTSKRWPTK
jgi:hypothetical protein